MTKVIIIEDDPMVAAINKQYIEKTRGMNVVATFHNSQDAWDFIQQKLVDLVILDLYMPDMTGLNFLHLLRKHNLPIEIIMVTAANDSDNIQNAIRLGIIDYLIKPFDFERFQLAIDKYLMKCKLLNTNIAFTQDDVDSLVTLQQTQKSSISKEMQKGIQEITLRSLLTILKQATPNSLTCEDLAKTTNLSKVTVRRYMNYLIEQNQVISEMDYSTGGRPSIHYLSL